MLQPREGSPGCRELNASCCCVIPTCIFPVYLTAVVLDTKEHTHTHAHTHTKQRLVNVKFLAKQENGNRNNLLRVKCGEDGGVTQSCRTK